MSQTGKVGPRTRQHGLKFLGSPRPWAVVPLRSKCKLTSHCSATRGLWATDLVILNHGQVTRMTPELAPQSPNYHTTPTGGRLSSRQI
ncbi:hypothetical protein TNCV_3664221 [Trichonephila clavipes]|nr:hypothetical protein TNCV_3664221 [Trichonephila clavipes]